MEFISIKNWHVYQHYKDRNPPWIKFHVSLLSDYGFCSLPDYLKLQLCLLFLLASKLDNKIPNDPGYIQNQLHVENDVRIDLLMEKGFIVPWSPPDDIDWGNRYIPKELKDKVFKRDCGVCQACGSKQDIEYDHIIPVSHGGESIEENLQLLCRSCNRRKRAMGAADWVNKYAPHLRSRLLRSTACLRSIETETETKKEKKNNKLPPAIKAFRSAVHRYPAKSWYQDIDDIVGRDPDDVGRWRAVCKDWVGRGWNPINVSGMLDKYKTDVPEEQEFKEFD